jgi:hypothetical protein
LCHCGVLGVKIILIWIIFSCQGDLMGIIFTIISIVTIIILLIRIGVDNYTKNYSWNFAHKWNPTTLTMKNSMKKSINLGIKQKPDWNWVETSNKIPTPKFQRNQKRSLIENPFQTKVTLCFQSLEIFICLNSLDDTEKKK